MKYFKIVQSVMGAGLVIVSTMSNATAGGFADALKDFVLGREAHASIQGSQLPITSISYQCMRCHDGSRGQAITLKSTDTALRFTGHTNSDHPVGMRYSEYARPELGSYVDPARLDNRVQLENGEVTCITCHETDVSRVTAASLQLPAEAACTATGNLTVGSTPTDLCLSCHVM